MVQLSVSRLRIGDQIFTRIPNGDSTLEDFGVLEELQFKGKYRDQQGNVVTFTATGGVSGLDSMKYYIPMADYTEVIDTASHIWLGPRPGREGCKEFGYRFDKDSLLIYQLHCDSVDSKSKDCIYRSLGQRMYTLFRISW